MMEGNMKRLFLVLLLLGITYSQEMEETPEEEETLTIEETSPYEMEEPLVTNIFYDTDIRDALRDISAQTGIPIIVDETVRGFVTIEFQDVPFEECLRRLLAPGGYTFKKMDTYYIVGSPNPDNPAFPYLTVTELVKPSYIKAEDAAQLLSDFYEPYLKVNKETNTLSITASPDIIARFKRDLKAIDQPAPQVSIEALITEFSKEATKSLGIDWSWLGTYGSRGEYTLSILSSLAEMPDTSLGAVISRTYGTWKGWSYDYIASLQALIRDGKVKIRATPRVTTLNGKTAVIDIGREEYYSIVTGPITYPYTRLEVIKVGIVLKITPYISENGEITVQIEPEVSDVVARGVSDLPVVSKRKVTTTVRVKDGETIVIGGLLQRNERNVLIKIPILGSIPILGYLFRNTRKEIEETEVIVFITPRLLKG
jgi:type IV pilus assembly protein PilQ